MLTLGWTNFDFNSNGGYDVVKVRLVHLLCRHMNYISDKYKITVKWQISVWDLWIMRVKRRKQIYTAIAPYVITHKVL